MQKFITAIILAIHFHGQAYGADLLWDFNESSGSLPAGWSSEAASPGSSTPAWRIEGGSLFTYTVGAKSCWTPAFHFVTAATTISMPLIYSTDSDQFSLVLERLDQISDTT